MKRKLILRTLLGVPLGITIGYIMTIMTSLVWANGYYSPCAPAMIDQFGSEILAVIVQMLLCGLLGGVYAGASVIWEIEDISIVKQTGLYIIILAVTIMPIAYITYWMEHTWLGFIQYTGIFVLIFVIIWMSQYYLWKKKIEDMNHRIHKL